MRDENGKYIPTAKEFELEYCRDINSEQNCEHHCTTDEYARLYNYTRWLEREYSKRVDMTKMKGYRF